MPRKKSTIPLKELKEGEHIVCCWNEEMNKRCYENASFHHHLCSVHIYLKDIFLKEKEEENEST